MCIEALRLQSVSRSYAVACIVSYDARPEQFQPFIDQQVRNRKPVLYCNDGHFGGTRIGTVQDQRMPSWLRDSFPEGYRLEILYSSLMLISMRQSLK